MEEKTRTLALTEKEYDLIQAIRDYRKSYIFSSRQIELYIETTLAELMAGEEWQTNGFHHTEEPS